MDSTPENIETQEKIEEEKKEENKEEAKEKENNAEEIENDEDSNEEGNEELEERYKMVIIVRTDLGMSIGKVAAQVGHAVIGAYEESEEETLDKWDDCGSPKVVLKVPNLPKMLEIEEKAKASGLVTYLVEDAGRTEVEPGTTTVLAIGPDAESKINAITGKLSLLK
ncbi:unnamed protein product [Blepharisma stoltei]|uniref:peptidyl-tRNA hydrolase n=1 Tax=Blepharisma stoltei TaxID=1481888 RepID=A0AAU9K8N7_9CILI|nr:unnamed protein product [Blepharisma stoltei]